MKLNTYLSFLLIACALFLSSCGDDKKPTIADVKPADVKQVNPFPFYKNIEIRPGFTFEIISWGKGVDSIGGYSIFLSDSLRKNYKSISVERKGKITDAWNMDLDTDGNPELYIQTLKNKNEADLVVYEFYDNDFHKISFPALSTKTRKIYLGNDKFFIKNGELFRTIPVKDEADTSGKAKTEMTVNYVLQGNSFGVK